MWLVTGEKLCWERPTRRKYLGKVACEGHAVPDRELDGILTAGGALSLRQYLVPPVFWTGYAGRGTKFVARERRIRGSEGGEG